ncbi:Protein FecR [Pseudomonas reidholzensis]|uniref:Protein FecR n=1 Tax=Pseudomonas reidholzensis TaxID=1785162 RepID=A0A383RPN0_9PSED|nr:FecR family protein [Pseudomonas reidholzensis]SYX89020.1 Protein FecR [Pseudomonas reidholzensis]
MNQRAEIPEALYEQASLWHVRLREADADDALRDAHRRWLAADPLHAHAWAETLQLWGQLAMPVARVRAEQQARWHSRHGAHRRFKQLALAACLVASVTLGALWQQDALDGLGSDYHTAVGERRSVELADGSRVELNTHSAIDVDFSEGRRTVRLIRGEAWFAVHKDPNRPFIVSVPFGQVKVTGTRFNVRLQAQQATVSLLEGRVELSGAGQVAVLEPGQQSRLLADGLTPPDAFDAQTVDAWRQGQLVFYRTPLKAVISELERYHPGYIFIRNPALAELPVSGVFSTRERGAALRALHDTLGVEVQEIGLGVVLLR